MKTKGFIIGGSIALGAIVLLVIGVVVKVCLFTKSGYNAKVVVEVKSDSDAIIGTSEHILRERIDDYCSYPMEAKVERVPGTNQIAIDLSGIDEYSRVEKLITTRGLLEFWSTYNGTDLFDALYRADARLRGVETEDVVETPEVAQAEEANAAQL